MLLVIMLNRSRFVYSVLHSLLSLFAFSLDHLTTTYAVSSRTARPNRSSLYHLTVFVIFGGDGHPYLSFAGSGEKLCRDYKNKLVPKG